MAPQSPAPAAVGARPSAQLQPTREESSRKMRIEKFVVLAVISFNSGGCWAPPRLHVCWSETARTRGWDSGGAAVGELRRGWRLVSSPDITEKRGGARSPSMEQNPRLRSPRAAGSLESIPASRRRSTKSSAQPCPPPSLSSRLHHAARETASFSRSSRRRRPLNT